MLHASAKARPLFLAAALLATLALLGTQAGGFADRLRGLPLYDYIAFWAAGRLNQEGHDPYDTERLAVVERAAEPSLNDVLVMWPAPWALTLVGPFSRFDSHAGHPFWLLLQLAALVTGLELSWRVYGGDPRQRGWAWLVAFTFLPTYMVLTAGQLGGLILLGLAGFLVCLRRGRPGWAGACLVLVAVKPQLTYLFWPALLLWAWERRAGRLVLGGVLAGLALVAWPLWDNPALPLHYWHSLTQRTQTHSHLSPLLGAALRLCVGPDHLGWQFVPMVPGVVWLAWYWRRHRRDWDWAERLPAILFASFLTAPYGAWPFDLVVLLPALLQRAAAMQGAPRRAALAFAAHLGITLLALIQLLHQAEYFWFVWLTPALLLLWLLSAPPARRAEVVPAVGPLALDA
jgi:hypothetical protein